MAIGWQVAGSRRVQVAPAPAAAVLAGAVLAVLAVLAILAVTDYRPLTPVRGDSGGYRVGGASAGAQTAAHVGHRG